MAEPSIPKLIQPVTSCINRRRSIVRVGNELSVKQIDRRKASLQLKQNPEKGTVIGWQRNHSVMGWQH